MAAFSRLLLTFALAISVASIPISAEARPHGKAKSSHRKISKKKKRKKSKSKRSPRKKARGRKRRGRRSRKPAPETWTARPAAAVMKPTAPKNAYSDSPEDANLAAPGGGAIPLHPPGEAAEERRVRLDMTKPYGSKKPEATPGPGRGIASDPTAPPSDLLPGEYGPPPPPK